MGIYEMELKLKISRGILTNRFGDQFSFRLNSEVNLL